MRARISAVGGFWYTLRTAISVGMGVNIFIRETSCFKCRQNDTACWLASAHERSDTALRGAGLDQFDNNLK